MITGYLSFARAFHYPSPSVGENQPPFQCGFVIRSSGLGWVVFPVAVLDSQQNQCSLCQSRQVPFVVVFSAVPVRLPLPSPPLPAPPGRPRPLGRRRRGAAAAAVSGSGAEAVVFRHAATSQSVGASRGRGQQAVIWSRVTRGEVLCAECGIGFL